MSDENDVVDRAVAWAAAVRRAEEAELDWQDACDYGSKDERAEKLDVLNAFELAAEAATIALFAAVDAAAGQKVEDET